MPNIPPFSILKLRTWLVHQCVVHLPAEHGRQSAPIYDGSQGQTLQPFPDRQTFAVKRLSKEFYARKQMTDKAVGAGKMGLVQEFKVGNSSLKWPRVEKMMI